MVDKSGKEIAQYQYTLGDGGERTKVTEEGPEGTIETSYAYDKAGRLVEESIHKGEKTTTYKYEYDAVGNRTEKSENSDITKYVYNSRNQLVEEQFKKDYNSLVRWIKKKVPREEYTWKGHILKRYKNNELQEYEDKGYDFQ